MQLQEERADALLKSSCSKDSAEEELPRWIQECSVSGGCRPARPVCSEPTRSHGSFWFPSGAAAVTGAAPGLAGGAADAGGAAEAAGGHVCVLHPAVRPPVSAAAAARGGAGAPRTAHQPAGKIQGLAVIPAD